jgi:ribose transport system ATP-binding protein
VSSVVDEPLVEALGLTKTYGGVRALDDASVALRAGEIRGLVGANGAGKSTLVKSLTGMVRPTAGSVAVEGRPLVLGRPADALRRGIVSVPQELTVAPTMTVAENVMLGHEPTRAGLVRRREVRRRAAAALESLALDVPLGARVGELTLLEQRLVMIARALSRSPRLAIFDEPTATLSPVETTRLLTSIRTLASRGVAVLYVSHHLTEIEELCDAATVLRDGRVLAELGPGEVTHRTLVQLLAADERSDRALGAASAFDPSSPVVLDVRDVSGERLRGVSVIARAGEIVGLAGLAGSGARELVLTVCGAVPFESGSIRVGERSLAPRASVAAVRAGVGFLPGDRSLGAFPSHSVRRNVSLPSLRRYARGWIIDPRAERRDVATVLERVGVTSDPGRLVSALSGGNQQKALVARWIAAGARLLLLDDPTAGVDVATRPEIQGQIRALAEDGAAIVLISTDVEELAELAHRVVVFERGAVTAELRAGDLTPARVLAAMTAREDIPVEEDPFDEREETR